MIIESIMNTSVPTLTPTNSIKDALQLLKEKRIRHIPIVNSEQEVLGVVTDRDLKEATPSSLVDIRKS